MSEVNERTYEYNMGDKTFVMKPLVLGQVKLLSNLLKDRFPEDMSMSDMTVLDIIGKVQDILPEVFAIILIEKGSVSDLNPRLLKNRNLTEQAEEFESILDLNIALEVCNDFFECTPLISAFQTLIGLIAPQSIEALNVTQRSESKTISTGSTESFSTSAAETSSNET